MLKNTIRFFITPKIKWFQNGKQGHGHCWRRCGNSLADHFHIFWDCAVIWLYWLGIVAVLKLIFGLEIIQDFSTIYLGKIPSKLNQCDKYLLQILLAASKKAIFSLQSSSPKMFVLHSF